MTLILSFYIAAVIFGMLLGGVAVALAVLRWWPRVTVHQVNVTPEAIARGIAAGGGIHCNVPAAGPVMVDWTLIHSVIDANGYMLIGKNEPGAPRQH